MKNKTNKTGQHLWLGLKGPTVAAKEVFKKAAIYRVELKDKKIYSLTPSAPLAGPLKDQQACFPGKQTNLTGDSVSFCGVWVGVGGGVRTGYLRNIIIKQ